MLWQEAAAGVVLAVLTVIYFWRQVFGGQALYWGDIGLYFTPMQAFLADSLRHGRLPLWNPLILCGTPYVGNPQTWPLYPFTIFLPLMGAARFLNSTIVFHIWLAGLGTFLFLRRALPVGWGAALLGAVVFMFGGQLVSKEQFPNMVQASAYLPWILLALRTFLLRQTVGSALLLGAAMGLQLLAAHAQITMLTMYLAVAYGLSVRGWRPSLRLIGLLVLVGVVIFGLAAGELLPIIQFLHEAWRQVLTFKIVNRFFLHSTQLGNFVFPFREGHPYSGIYTGHGNYWETCCYVGALPFLAALGGGIFAWTRKGLRSVRFWSGVFLVGLAMAMGGSAYLYIAAYHYLPGFRNFHDPARCLMWVCFALSALSSYGLEMLMERRPQSKKLLASAFVLLGFADLAYFGQTIYPLVPLNQLYPPTQPTHVLLSDPAIHSGQARYLAPDGVWVWNRFSPTTLYRQDAPEYQQRWEETLTSNLMMPYGLMNAFGYEPIASLDTTTISETSQLAFQPRHTSGPLPPEGVARWNTAASAMGMLGVKFVASYGDTLTPPLPPGFTPIVTVPTLTRFAAPLEERDFVTISQDENWLPRARLMPHFAAFPTERQAVLATGDAFLDTKPVDFATTAIVQGQVPFASDPTAQPSLVPMITSTPDQVTLTPTVTQPTLLVLADANLPGWQATVDGHKAPILPCNVMLRAVPLPTAGPHTVIFTYKPVAFLLGLYFTLLTAGFLVGAAVYHRMATRPGKSRS